MGRSHKKKRRLTSLSEQISASEFCEEVQREATESFEKTFTYKHPKESPNDDEPQWTITEADQFYASTRWADRYLQKLKLDLNEVKNSLSDTDIAKWHHHTRSNHPAGAVNSFIKAYKSPELCTQAWCKFYEILGSFSILPSSSDASSLKGCGKRHTITSVHLCEGPGAFIASLNHYLHSHDIDCEWYWTAMTLNPYNEANIYAEMIDDDQFIFNTMDNWYFGEDNTGDMMAARNLTGLIHYISQSPSKSVDLVTADGSIDCQNNPSEQESHTARLHSCEVIAGMHLLASGGAMVIKMFTLFECQTVSLMYLLNCTFNEVNVFKPANSKAGNSEVYVVCTGYKRPEQSILDRLLIKYGKDVSEQSLFAEDQIPSSFFQQHHECCKKFTDLQIDTIHSNQRLFNQMDNRHWKHIKNLQACVAATYINRFGVRKLSRDNRIVACKWMNRGADRTLDKIMRRFFQHTGSFNDRQLWHGLTWDKQIQLVQKCVISDDQELSWLKFSSMDGDYLDVSCWHVQYGARIEGVNSSHFCSSTVLSTYNRLIQHAPPTLCRSSSDVTKLEVVVTDLLKMIVDAKPSYSPKAPLQVFVPVVTGKDGLVVKQLQNTLENIQVCVMAEQQGSAQSYASSPSDRLLVVEDVYDSHSDCDSKFEELLFSNKSKLVTSLCRCFKVLNHGDHLICTFPGSQSRFSLGFLYILYAVFTKISLVCVRADGRAPYYISCIGFTELSLELKDFISTLQSCFFSLELSQQSAEQSLNNDIVQIVPIQCLYDELFFNYVTSCNTRHLELRINHLVDQLRALVGPDVELTDEERKLINSKVTDMNRQLVEVTNPNNGGPST